MRPRPLQSQHSTRNTRSSSQPRPWSTTYVLPLFWPQIGPGPEHTAAVKPERETCLRQAIGHAFVQMCTHSRPPCHTLSHTYCNSGATSKAQTGRRSSTTRYCSTTRAPTSWTPGATAACRRLRRSALRVKRRWPPHPSSQCPDHSHLIQTLRLHKGPPATPCRMARMDDKTTGGERPYRGYGVVSSTGRAAGPSKPRDPRVRFCAEHERDCTHAAYSCIHAYLLVGEVWSLMHPDGLAWRVLPASES
jgi:hypothetical protein